MRKTMRPELDSRIGQLMFDAAPVGMVVLARTHRFLRANPVFCRFIGYTEQELKARTVHDITHPDDRAETLEKERAVWSKGRRVDGFEKRYLHKSGRVVWGRVSAIVPGRGGTRADFSIAQIADITERRRAEAMHWLTEEALRRSESMYRSTLNAMGDAIHVVDDGLRIVLLNKSFKRWARQLGLPGKAVGLPLFTVFPFLSVRVKREYQRVLKHGVTLHTEETSRVGSRDIVTETWKIPVCEDGRVVRIVTVVRDITERKRTEDALRLSETRLKSLAENVPSVLMRYDRQLRVVYLSPQSEAITGIPVAQFLGKTNAEVGMPRDLCRRWETAITRVFSRGRNVDMEFDFPSPQGRRSFLLRLAPERAGNGPVKYVLGVSTEITERKRLEEQLKGLNEGLEARVRERTSRLRDLASELTKAEHRERRRIADVLHEDLQQRLVSMIYSLGRPKECYADPAAVRDVERLQGELRQCIGLSRDLTSQLRPPVLYELGLPAALDWLAEDMRDRFGLRVSMTGERSFHLASDELRLFAYEAVRELLMNVVKHAGVRTAAMRIAWWGRDTLAIAVSDKGKGFAGEPQRHPRSFGLFSIRERINAFGGRLEMTSQPGKGTRALLLLPALRQPPRTRIRTGA